MAPGKAGRPGGRDAPDHQNEAEIERAFRDPWNVGQTYHCAG
jgi:hypothetical protein